ncbi:chalcone isomerase family protein [Pseudomonas sp. NY15463]|uniref:chalcone isomerase family protein n=1 Tax=Pseudomonas sp. NY15463 TaxID=3400361 RepID=UPI003A838C88
MKLPVVQRLGDGELIRSGECFCTVQLWALGPVHDWNRPFALELLYHRSMSKGALVQEIFEQMCRVSASSLTPPQCAVWPNIIDEAFVEVRPGMRITGVFLPGQGCSVYVDGKLSREITDPLFARTFFSIWLAPCARDTQLRQRLLGLAGNDRGA